MKSLKGILLLASFVMASAAHAKAACTIYVAADPSQPNNQEKVIFTGPVTPSPSSNEEDKRRMSYVIVKRDLSATTVITHDELDRRDQAVTGKISTVTLWFLIKRPSPEVFTAYLRPQSMQISKCQK